MAAKNNLDPVGPLSAHDAAFRGPGRNDEDHDAAHRLLSAADDKFGAHQQGIVANTEAIEKIPPQRIVVNNTCKAVEGQFVSMVGTGTLKIADAGATNVPATHVVLKIEDNKLVLVKSAADVNVKIRDGRGVNRAGKMYLSLNGSATDEPNDIFDATTQKLKTGITVRQTVGDRIGEPKNGYVPCSVTIVPAQTAPSKVGEFDSVAVAGDATVGGTATIKTLRFPNPAGTKFISVTAPAIVNDVQLNPPLISQDETFAVVPVTGSAANQDPAGTTSGTALMMGGGVTFIPRVRGKALVIVTGHATNDTGNEGAVIGLRYGNSSPPSNGDAVAGAQVGASITAQCVTSEGTTSPVSILTCPFAIVGYVESLTLGDTYWVQLSLARTAGGTASVANCNFVVIEL